CWRRSCLLLCCQSCESSPICGSRSRVSLLLEELHNFSIKRVGNTTDDVRGQLLTMTKIRFVKFVTLPLWMAGRVMMNCVFTLSTLSHQIRDLLYEFFLNVVELRRGSSYLNILQDGIWDYHYFWQRMGCLLRWAWTEAVMEAEEGGKAPDPLMIRLSDNSKCHLLDLLKPGRPLVLNFGSCT
ncbi:hypothetical protein OTU49_011805, partial [Cherax quadricarinatus]